MSNSQPTYIYKILPEPPPTPLPQTLPLSSLDQNDGFIHLSTATQTSATATRFFSEHDELWLLKLRYTDLVSAGLGTLKWEVAPGVGEEFPHLYGSGLGCGNVVEVIRVKRGDGGWGDVLGKLEG